MNAWFNALIAVLVAIPIAVAVGYMSNPDSKPAPARVIHHEGLARFPVLDSRQEIAAGLFIVCKAYANRPGFDVSAPVTQSALGFRVLSDCRTVEGS